MGIDYKKFEAAAIENIKNNFSESSELKKQINAHKSENGGKLIGRWPTEGYEFDNSLALDGDEFLGLGLDNDNEEELTEERLIIWAELIRDEFVA